MAVLGVLVGLWFFGMGAFGVLHAERAPDGPAGHWMSFPGGRRVGGSLTMAVGMAVIVASLLWL